MSIVGLALSCVVRYFETLTACFLLELLLVRFLLQSKLPAPQTSRQAVFIPPPLVQSLEGSARL